MMNEPTEELAALYALDLLEGEEFRRFEEQLKGDADLRALVDEMRHTAAILSYRAPSRMPPASLKGQIFAELRRHKRSAAFPLLAGWLPWTIAACLTIACALLATESVRLHGKLARLESRDVMAQVQIATLNSKLKSAPRATAVVIWDAERQRGVLKVTNVPPNESDQDYQLWVTDPKRKLPVSGAVFGVDRDGTTKISFKPDTPITSAQTFAISLERKGGVRKAEGPIVLLSK